MSQIPFRANQYLSGQNTPLTRQIPEDIGDFGQLWAFLPLSPFSKHVLPREFLFICFFHTSIRWEPSFRAVFSASLFWR